MVFVRALAGIGISYQMFGIDLHTARQLGPLDVRLARETYLDALAAAIFVGRLAGGADLPEVARAALGAPPTPQPRAPDLLLDGLAVLITDGYEAGTPALQPAVAAFRSGDLTLEDELRWFFVACHAAHDLWDDEGWYALSARHLQLARDVGALSVLPLALAQRVGAHLHAGEFGAAASLVEETAAITEATRNDLPPYSALALAGWQGRAAEAAELIHTAINGLTIRGEGMGLGLVRHTSAVLSNGLGRYRDALTAADEASAYPQELGFANWGLAELAEAAVRCGETARAADAVERLARTTAPAAPPGGWASRRARARWSATAKPPNSSTGRRSTGSASAAARSPWPARTWSTGNGYGGRTGAPTPGPSCGRPTTCSRGWEPRRSPSVPAASCSPPGRPSASARRTYLTSSPRRSGRSPGGPGTGSPIPRSARSCS